MNLSITPRVAGVLLLLLPASCGQSDDAPRRFNESINGVAPTAGRVTRGALQDFASYQPAAMPGGPAVSGAAPADSGDTEGQVRQFVQNLAESLSKLDVEAVVDAVNPEHVAELKKDLSPLLEAREKLELFMNVVRDKFGQGAATGSFDPSQLKSLLDKALAVEVLDAQSAALKLNPDGVAAIMQMSGQARELTPEQKQQMSVISLSVLKQDGAWKIQLPAPITEAQVAQLRIGLDVAKTAFDTVIENIENGTISAPEQIQMAMQAAFMGAAMNKGKTEASQPAEEPKAEIP
ncbi:MAG: hypothetical protein U1D55_07755 [Phycisphaerae bacterium]